MKFTIRTILFLLLVIPMSVMAQSSPKQDNIALKKLKTTFTNLCSTQQFSGVVLVAINGKIRFEKACGYASRNFLAPNTITTKFNLGSVGKLFTIVATAQLVEDNKLSLNTHVKPLIPGWLPMQNANLITVGQLLIHASGLGNFMQDKRWQLGADSGLYNTIKEYKPLVSSEKLLFKPGTSQAYSNSGYLILGALIEKLSNESYSQYIKSHIFSPIGMTNTGIYPLDEVVRNRAVGYYRSCKNGHCEWKNNYYAAPFIGTSAGGAYSTAGDLFKFSQALYHKQLLNAALTRQVLSTTMLRPSNKLIVKPYKIGNLTVAETFSPYGFAGSWNKFGFAIWHNPSLIGHTGGTPGAGALFLMSPTNKYTIIILGNNSPVGMLTMYKGLRKAFGFSGKIENF